MPSTNRSQTRQDPIDSQLVDCAGPAVIPSDVDRVDCRSTTNAGGNSRLMLISKEKNRYAYIDTHKVRSGRFLTRSDVWLQPQVLEFARNASPEVVLDPFAGNGHMLTALQTRMAWPKYIGIDIHPHGDVLYNDSLRSIPPIPRALIVTNPPYLAKHSAARKRVISEVASYFHAEPDLNDLYLIALKKCLQHSDNVIAIVPETFINAQAFRSRLRQITVLETNPFEDTDCPVVVACFGGEYGLPTHVFRDRTEIGYLSDIEKHRMRPHKAVPIHFNVPDGLIGLQAVDSVDPDKSISFMHRSCLGYDTSGIKISSRLVTYVHIPGLREVDVDPVCRDANQILASLRSLTNDLVLSPFKGNRRDGRRRRRLDYATARAILEQAIDGRLVGESIAGDVDNLWKHADAI